MNTPSRPIRIDDELWGKAQRVAEDLAKETGFSVTASDVVRKALGEFIERHNTAKRATRAKTSK